MRPLVGLVFALAAGAACSYDWAMGGGAGDAGAADATGGDAAVDASGGDVEVDVGGDVEGDGEGDVDAGIDAPVDAPAEVSYCGKLETQVADDKLNAIKCTTTPPDCYSFVSDQCGCTVYVAQPSSQATSTYVNDVHELQDSGCPLGCGSCGPPPTSANCLVNAQDIPVCTPP
jgi:hypothetical protein